MANETNNNLTPEQMAARIAELEGRLAKGGSLSFKVSEKGAVSVYGLGRFPVTLYLEQWDALHSHAAELRQFIEANKSRLKTKEQKEMSIDDLRHRIAGETRGRPFHPLAEPVAAHQHRDGLPGLARGERQRPGRGLVVA